MVGMDKNSSTCSTFVGDASAYRMEADRKRLPAGIAPIPMHGWLFCTYSHELHSCLTDRKVPTCHHCVDGDKHLEQAA